MTPIKLVNESALGIFSFTWQSGPARKRNEIVWYEGLGNPMLSFYISTTARMSPPVVIQRPERFGWSTPMNLKKFKAFVQSFADTCEQEDEDES